MMEVGFAYKAIGIAAQEHRPIRNLEMATGGGHGDKVGNSYDVCCISRLVELVSLLRLKH